MGWVIYLFGSGAAFFLGVGLVVAAAGARALTRRRWLGSVATLSALTGLILIALSATPLPYAFYFVAAAVTFVWLFAEESGREPWKRRRAWLRAAAVVIWLLGALAELPYHFAPSLRVTGRPPLYILGDSVSAGLGDREVETWPRLLAREQSIEVHDFSRPGATTAAALRQAEQLPAEGGLVLLEVGGNDLFGSTPAAKFEHDLDQLLGRVCHPEYGRVQRLLAVRHGVLLIPKRVFVAVLTGEGATIDSVHLDRVGHERMAEAVWTLIRSAYEQ
jgi:acyl-CoA thioesterase-1